MGKRRKLFGRLSALAVKHAGKVAKVAAKAADKGLDADRLLMKTMGGLIELRRNNYPLDPGAQWRPGEPLKLLLAGYAGTRNTGADVRVEEMIRQFRHLFGDDEVDLSILTLDPELTRGYFATVKQIVAPQIFPKFIFDVVHDQHGVIACEGSMFKSKFANALSTFMAGALGMASAAGKISVGYGGEAGYMDPPLASFVREHVKDSFIIARNEASVETMAKLGCRAVSGTDTAWTFDPAPPEVGERLLREAGWDGERPILTMAPINPFWWPVRADWKRGLVQSVTGAYDQTHYKSVYFHKGGEKVRARQEAYLAAFAQAANRVARERGAFVMLFGSEQLDRRACEQMMPMLRLDHEPALFVSDEYDMYQMVSVLRHTTALVSSRYHAIVCSMPGGVASAGVTMDERIRNLMIDRGTPELALEVDDPELPAQIEAAMNRLFDEGDEIRAGIDATIVKNLERMGKMGQILVDHVAQRHPEFPFRPELGLHGDPWDHLPSLPPNVQAIKARVAARVAADKDKVA